MIEEKQGRSRSVRTVDEELNSIRKQLKAMSAEEREALEVMLAEMQSKEAEADENGQGPEPTLLNAFSEAEYKTTPVDIQTFVHDPYYLGETCSGLYPKWLEDLTELFTGDYHEAIFTGSIGCGKTFAASVGICRVIYELSCMRDPHASYGIAHNSDISIPCMSVNEDLARKVVFGAVAEKIKESPYFKDQFPFEITKRELRFPGNIWVSARSSSDTNVVGLNAISAFMDETNYMPRSARNPRAVGTRPNSDRAETLYNAIKRRMKSRFERQGRLPGIFFIVSSKKTTDDFTARRIREAKVDTSVFVRDYATWDVKPDAYFNSKRFWVLCGNETMLSRIVPDDEVDKLRQNIPDGAVMIEVPEDFRQDFERDLEGAIRDMAGIATVAISPFIQRREKINEAIDPRRIHPFSTSSYDSSKGGTFRWDKMTRLTRERDYTGAEGMRERPIINPQAPRHIHIDPSLKNDATGFCMAHIAGFRDVQRRGEDGNQYFERAPVYYVDAILKIVPPLGAEIDLGDVRRLVYELTSHGYIITHVSMDQFQSADALQMLASKGYNVERVSVDVKMDPYNNLKDALYENRVMLYDYPVLVTELRQLEKDHNRQKVDHPPTGSKDCSDALAGTLYTLAQRRAAAQPLPMLRGDGYYAHADAWMPEQQQAMMGGQFGAGMNQMLVSPFFTGSNGGRDDWGGGWNPGSL